MSSSKGPGRPCHDELMRITAVQATELFGGSAQHPLQIIRVTVRSDGPAQPGPAGPVRVRVAGAAVSTPQAFSMTLPEPGRERTAEVGVHIAPPYQPGSPRPVTVIAESDRERAELAAEIRAAETGWTMWMVSHFHYDPVWWDTQGEFTETRLLLPDSDGRLPDVRTAFELVTLHLAHASEDPDYKFVLAEIDYLKPYLDTHPERRAELRQLIADGRVEIVGGNYNEPNTNLTSAESTIRNAIYGLGYQRGAGGDPRTAWMLDVFGHDPGYPGLMAAAGLSESAWARGPYHQWGPKRTVGDNQRMQLRSEFDWVSPDGQGLLTSYMPDHYGAGWSTHQAADLAGAEQAALDEFRSLAPVAATRNVLLPVGADHVIPSRWVTAIHRDWNRRYVWPRFVTAVPREFFAAVRADAAAQGRWLVPQTRDMNPVYPGKDVSYIDTKQAQRAAEAAVRDGELLATLAWLAGAGYPAQSLDKAWRQLVFGAHHDAITGTESDQVYLDLLGGWREAWQRGDAARRDAAAALAGQADTRRAGSTGAGEQAVVVFNTLSWPRSGLVTTALEFGAPGPAWISLRGESAAVPFLAEHTRRHPDGGLAGVTLTFRADGVPGVGYRTYWAVPVAAEPGPAGWEPQPGALIETGRFLAEADPARGGTLTRLRDKLAGTDLLRPGGNELLVQEEYDHHPRWGEGPWLLSPKGPGTGSAAGPAKVTAQRCPLGARLLAEFTLGDLRVTQETLLWDGAQAVEFRTHVDGPIGHDRLLRARFPADVPGGLPVYQGATAVIGRPFGSVDADVAEYPFTLDNPAHEWFGTGSTARVGWAAPSGRAEQRAIGVAEVILPGPGSLPDAATAISRLVAALAGQGVTATCSWPDGPRYGSLDLDSNVPDVRIAVGGPEQNPWTARLLATVDPSGAEFGRALAAGAPLWLPAAQSRAQAFGPGADVRGPRDLPVLIVAGPDLAAAAAAAAADLADSVIGVTPLGDDVTPGLAGHSVALLNRGTPSSLVTPDGTLHIALMRSCSAWPSGVWIGPDKRTAPDGSSFAWQHWGHTYEYALAAGPGDWRAAGFTAAAAEYNHDLIPCEGGGPAAPLAPGVSLVSVGHPAVLLCALKPHGNPLARGRPGLPAAGGGLTMRLRETTGRPARARVRLRGGIAAAQLTDLLEQTDLGPVPVEDEDAIVGLPPFGTVTVVLRPVVPPATALDAEPPAAEGTTNLLAETAVPDGTLAGLLEPAQPVYGRYWLHGKGPAPAGNLPVAVHIAPHLSGLSPAPPGGAGPGGAGGGGIPAPGAAMLRVTVACGPEPAAGTLRLIVPAELSADFGAEGLGGATAVAYDLRGRGYADWNVTVRARPGAPPGRYVVAAQISDDLGQVIEDAAMVQAGGPGEPDLYAPLQELLPMIEAGAAAATAELALAVRTPELRIAPGRRAELAVELTSGLASPIRGEAQLVSPFGSWESLGPWTQGFGIAAGGRAAVTFRAAVPASARPGTRWWAVVKVMFFGRVRYSEAVPVTVTG